MAAPEASARAKGKRGRTVGGGRGHRRGHGKVRRGERGGRGRMGGRRDFDEQAHGWGSGRRAYALGGVGAQGGSATPSNARLSPAARQRTLAHSRPDWRGAAQRLLPIGLTRIAHLERGGPDGARTGPAVAAAGQPLPDEIPRPTTSQAERKVRGCSLPLPWARKVGMLQAASPWNNYLEWRPAHRQFTFPSPSRPPPSFYINGAPPIPPVGALGGPEAEGGGEAGASDEEKPANPDVSVPPPPPPPPSVDEAARFPDA